MQSKPDSQNGEVPLHSAAVRQSRRTKEQQSPDEFDESKKDRAMQVTKVHEFRRENIRDYEVPDKDYFEYDPNEKKRYDALKVETIFKFPTTYKAIKWGVAVGGMFAFHRYYRTRDINAAAHWFTVMSFVSFFNIWVSYRLQEFVTEYGSKQGLSLSARNEYHTNAYKNYLENVEQKVQLIDTSIQPQLRNSQAEALDDFIDTYETYAKEVFGTTELTKDEILNQFVSIREKPQDSLTASEMLRAKVISRDQFTRQKFQIARDETLTAEMVRDVLSSIDSVDLKSYDFSKDKDLSYRP